MNKIFRLSGSALVYGLIFIICGLFLIMTPVCASDDTTGSSRSLTLIEGEPGGERIYSVDGSSYVIYMNDEEDLLNEKEEDQLLADMLPITEYGNAAFMTGLISQSDYEGATGDIYHSLFGSDSGTIFMIDMNHRKLIIFSDGDVYKIISKRYASTITDNVYKKAKKGNYYDCASEAFREMTTLLKGNRIAQPMRHITNAMLAVILAALILYFITRYVSMQRTAKAEEIFAIIKAEHTLLNGRVTYTRKTRTYNPHTSSGGGGSRGGFGGGSSGGGGSHGF